MQRSRLAGFIIDRKNTPPAEGTDLVKKLEVERFHLVVVGESNQRVEHERRLHLDIESDDVDAEAARLEALGARRLEEVHTWWVMEAPTGRRFCVVRARRPPDALPGATLWP